MSFEYLLPFKNIVYLIKSSRTLIFNNGYASQWVYKNAEKLTVDFYEPGAGSHTPLFLGKCESFFVKE